MKTTMKIAVIAMMGMSLGINAQENKIGNTGNVGIGILSPEHKLHVKNDTGDSFTLIDASVNSGIRFLNGVNSFIEKRSGSGSLTIKNQVSQGRLQFGTENITRMTILPNGDVGIGTTSPATKLHVKGVSQIEHSNGRSIRFDGYEGITTYGPSHWLHLNRYSNDNVAIGHNSIANVFLAYGGGNVGIGTTSPSSKLDVNYGAGSLTSIGMKIMGGGSVYENITLSLQDTGTAANNINILEFKNAGVRNGIIKSVNPTTGSITGGNLILETTSNNSGTLNSNQLVLKNNGNVGIGTTNTKGFKLGVLGKIIAEEVKIALYDNWSDFVFEKNYELPTLNEVEKHIKEKGHLKDIPSAKEVEKNGIFLGEMDAKLLQKIEELTLYAIAQDKEIKVLKKQNSKIEKLEKQSKLLKSLTERLTKIEELLKKKN